MALLAVIPITVLWHHNKDSRKVERFFYETDQQKYILLQVAVFVLTVAFLINTRTVVSHFLNIFIDKWIIKIFPGIAPHLKTIIGNPAANAK